MIAQKEMRTAVIPTPNGELRNEDLDVPESGNAALPEVTEVHYAEDEAKLNGGSLCGSGVGHFLAQVFPDGFRHFEKSRDYVGVKLQTRPTFDFFPGGGDGLLLPIGAVRSDGIQGIGDRKDSSPQRNLFRLQVARIASAIEAFLMLIDDFCRFG